MEINEKDGLPIRNLIFNEDEMHGVYACSLVDSPAIDVEFMKFSKEEIIECNCSSQDELIDFTSEQIDLLLSKGEDHSDEWELLDEKKVESEDDLIDFASVVQDSAGDSIEDNEIFKVRYKYSPAQTSEKSRDFCKKMVAANKLFKADDLQLSNANPGLGPSGTDTYNIMLFKGGVNCTHFFTRQILFNKGNKAGVSTFEALKRIAKLSNADQKKAKFTPLDPKVSQVASADNNYWRLSSESMKFSKTDEFKRILTSPVLIPEQLIYRKLSDGDCYVKADAETIEKLQQNFFKKQFNHNSTLEHDDNQIIEGVYFFESWIVEDEKNDKSNALGFNVPKGSWMLSMKVENEQIWNDYVLTGKIKGFSIDSQLGIEPLQKEKITKTNMKYSDIKNAIMTKILLEAELKEFKIDENLSVQAESLDKDQVVFDMEKNPFANAEFVYEDNSYKTDENGVIIEIEPVEKVEIEQADEENGGGEEVANVEELKTELEAANKKIEEQEIEIQSLKAEIVSLKAENVDLAKQPKVEGIQLNKENQDDVPADSALAAIRKALKK